MTKTKTEKKPKKSKKVAAQEEQVTKPAEILPAPAPVVEPTIVPRGQERLSDGTIRLKTGVHDLGDKAAIYSVHGADIELSGKVMIANKDVDWLSIGKCQKCGRHREKGVTICERSGMTVIRFRCENVNFCDLGGHEYVQVHTFSRFVIIK